MLRRSCVFVAVLIIASPARAGLFSTSISVQDAAQIKRLGVVSTVGDTVHGRLVGLVVFQNQSFDAPAAGWNLDQRLTKDLVGRVATGARIDGQITALAVLPEENPHDHLIAPGITLLRRKALGLDRVHPCNVVAVRVYRVSDGKQIGFAAPDPCSYKVDTKIWHDSWEAFSEEEKQATLAALQEFASRQLGSALVSLKLSDK